MSIVRLSLTLIVLASFGNAVCGAGQPPQGQTVTGHSQQLARNGDGDWWQFRGPGARGVADDASFPDRWSATEKGVICPVPRKGGIFSREMLAEGGEL
jgi:hypothetical protein